MSGAVKNRTDVVENWNINMYHNFELSQNAE
jgi:hypothetical protein